MFRRATLTHSSRRLRSVGGALVLVVAGAVWIAAGVMAEREIAEIRERGALEAKRLTLYLKQHVEEVLRYADAYVKAARREYVDKGLSLKPVRDFMALFPNDTQIISHITFINRNGIPIFNSGARLRPGVNTLDRDYYTYQRATLGDTVFLSRALRGRNSGKVLLRLARRINLPDGSFGGVVFAAVETKKILDFFQVLNLGRRSSATLVGTDKVVRARIANGEFGFGQDMGESRLWTLSKTSREGYYMQTSGVDGFTRHYYYSMIDGFPLASVIGVAEADIGDRSHLIRRDHYGGAGLFTLIIFGVGFFTYRQAVARDKLEELNRDLEFTRVSIERSTDSIFWIRRDGSFVFVNEAACRSLGYSHDELLAMRVPDIDCGFDGTPWDRHWEEMQHDHVKRISSRHRRKSGETFPVDVLVNLFRYGGEDYICAIARDMTENEKANEAIRQNEAQMRLITELLPAYISYRDCDHIVRFANRAYAERHGKTIDEIIGHRVDEKVWSSKGRQGVRSTLERTMAGETVVIERETKHLDGSERVHLTARAPHIDDKGEVVGYATVTQDVTEQKRLEAQLAQTQKLETIGQLTGGIAHDFNNLLAVIMGNAELLTDADPAHMAQIDAILRATQRGSELTQRLLAFSRQQPLNPRPVDLCHLVGAMKGMLGRLIGATITVETRLTWNTPAALVDPGQVENALLNLAVNARDAMPGGGDLLIGVEPAVLDARYCEIHLDAAPGRYVLLTVADNGIGMSHAVLERAIEPFFTTKDVGEGSGLGLSMVYGFTEQSGGHLAINSEEGVGTTVKLYLPCAETNAVVVETPEKATLPGGKGETVLVVEDDPDVRLLVVTALRRLGYKVIDAPKADAALETIATERGLDLLLTDVVLPGGMSGADIARHVRATHPDVRILLMSGYPAHTAKGLDLTDIDAELMTKPFTREVLAKKVREILDA